MGTWGGGHEKPFKYSDTQIKRFKLSTAESKEDRKVPAQPYAFSSTGDATDFRPNKRKLSELPYQLVKCKNYEDLKSLTFFSFEWLYAKIIGTSPQQLLEEMEMFIYSDKNLKKDLELKLLFANLQLMKSYVTRYPDSLPFELTGRLAKYIGKSPAITELLKGASTKGLRHCPIMPLGTCFASADLSLSQSITYRATEPWEEGGALTFSADFKTVYILDYDESGIPVIRVFDTNTGNKQSDLYIIKTKPENQKDTVDVYFQFHMLMDNNHILALYKQKYIVGMRHVYRSAGLFDVINIHTGQVVKSIEEPRKNATRHFFNPLMWITPHWACVKTGWRMTLYNLQTDQQIVLKKPTYLNPSDERFFILCGAKKTEMKHFETKKLIAEFDVVERQMAVAANKDMSLIAMIGSRSKRIRIYDLSNKHLHTSEDKPDRRNMLHCHRYVIWRFDVAILLGFGRMKFSNW